MASQGIGVERRLIVVPRMYTEEEMILATGGEISEEVKAEIERFWLNLEEKLSKFGRIHKIYRDMVTADGDGGAEQLSAMDPHNFRVVKSLMEKGAKLVGTEDPLLIREAEAWVGVMAWGSPSALELFRDNLRDRNRYIADRIEETLKPGEVGVLFIDPSRDVVLPKGLEVIRIESGSVEFVKALMSGKKVE